MIHLEGTSGVAFQEELVAQHTGSKPPGRGGSDPMVEGWLVGWWVATLEILQSCELSVGPPTETKATKIMVKCYKELG